MVALASHPGRPTCRSPAGRQGGPDDLVRRLVARRWSLRVRDACHQHHDGVDAVNRGDVERPRPSRFLAGGYDGGLEPGRDHLCQAQVPDRQLAGRARAHDEIARPVGEAWQVWAAVTRRGRPGRLPLHDRSSWQRACGGRPSRAGRRGRRRPWRCLRPVARCRAARPRPASRPATTEPREASLCASRSWSSAELSMTHPRFLRLGRSRSRNRSLQLFIACKVALSGAMSASASRSEPAILSRSWSAPPKRTSRLSGKYRK